MKIKSKLLSCLSVSLALINQGHAQNETADVLTPFNVIGSKEDVTSLQGSGVVLDSTDLKPFMHTDINEILRQVPGVYIRPEEGYGFFPNISLRGTDPGRSQKVTITVYFSRLQQDVILVCRNKKTEVTLIGGHVHIFKW